MATHKLFDEFCEEDYTLWALHCSLEDHHLVYAVNQYLRTHFHRTRQDQDLGEGLTFPCFEYYDPENDRNWTLFSNKCRKLESRDNGDLFGNTPAYRTHHLLPEYKEADYFIKIEGGLWDQYGAYLSALKEVPGMIAAYTVDTDRIKSKQNLIR